MNVFVYTEQDMQIAENAMEHYKRDATNARLLIWAMVKELGGSFAVPMYRLAENADCLLTQTDPETNSLVIEAK